MELSEMDEDTRKRKVLMPIKMPEELKRPTATIRPIETLRWMPSPTVGDSNLNAIDSNEKINTQLNKINGTLTELIP